jgi:hypothetical protein
MSNLRTAAVAIVVAVMASAATYAILARREPAAAPLAPLASIREVMGHIVEPSADGLFESVATISGPNGVVDKAPSTDEEWEHVETDAWTLAEATLLLRVPGRRVAKPGDVDPPGDPSAPELTAVQVQEKIDTDHQKWASYVDGLQAAAMKAVSATQKRDVKALFEVGEDIDQACEKCHLQYWYPENKAPVVPARATPAPAPSH